MAKRGFSLVELVFVAMLVSGMLLFSIMNFGGQKKRASSEALVQVVAAELQAARALALRQHSPVAVCLPTQRGSLAHCQSLYLMEGLARPHITRVVDYSREFDQSVVAIGCWGSCTISRPAGGENFTSPAPQRWLGNTFRDFALIFSADGAVTSNDLPLVDGAYHLLVAGQVGYSPTTAPPGTASMTTPPAYFRMDKVHAAQTLSISPAGSLTIQSGVASNGGVVVSPEAFAMAAPAVPPAIPSEAAQAPVIRQIDVQPRPTLNPKVTVQQGRSLTLKVDASDANGDPLLCSWTALDVGGAGQPGVFSVPAGSPMQWDPERQLWSLTTTWSPPSTSAVGSSYQLKCKVSDPSNLDDTEVNSALDPVTVIPAGRIVYSYYASPVRYDIGIVNADGSGNKRLTTDPADDDSPAISPDGKKIVFVSTRTGQTEIFTMNTDGTDQRRLTTNSVEDWSPHWSVDGTQIFFGRNWPDRVWVMNADGSGAQTLSTGGYASEYNIKQSPDGRYVAYEGNTNAPGVPSVSGEVVVGQYVNDHLGPPRVVGATNLTNNAALRIMDHFQCWYPDNSGRFLYTSVDPQGAQYYSNAAYSLNVARVVDNGVAAVPRFSLADKATLANTSYSGVEISPDMRSLVYSSGMIADFNPAVTPPTLSNVRRLTNQNYLQNPGNWSRR